MKKPRKPERERERDRQSIRMESEKYICYFTSLIIYWSLDNVYSKVDESIAMQLNHYAGHLLTDHLYT
jgi:hypothetical protein